MEREIQTNVSVCHWYGFSSRRRRLGESYSLLRKEQFIFSILTFHITPLFKEYFVIIVTLSFFVKTYYFYNMKNLFLVTYITIFPSLRDYLSLMMEIVTWTAKGFILKQIYRFWFLFVIWSKKKNVEINIFVCI